MCVLYVFVVLRTAQPHAHAHRHKTNQPTAPITTSPKPQKSSATPEDIPADTPANRQRGWARMALQILFLGPTRFSTFRLVERRLLVSPVIQTFVYSKVRVC